MLHSARVPLYFVPHKGKGLWPSLSPLTVTKVSKMMGDLSCSTGLTLLSFDFNIAPSSLSGIA